MSKKRSILKFNKGIVLYFMFGLVVVSTLIATILLQQKQSLRSLAKGSTSPLFEQTYRVRAVSFTACALTKAYWVTSDGSGTVERGLPVNLRVEGAGDCDGEVVEFSVKQNQGVFGAKAVSVNPDPVSFEGNTASGRWIAEHQGGMIGGLTGSPQYFFQATVSRVGSTAFSDSSLLVR